jgi:Sulfotransferase domain
MRLLRRWFVAARDADLAADPSLSSDDDGNLILSFPKSGRTWLAYLYAYYACYRVVGDQADRFIDREFTPTAHVYRPLEHPALRALHERSGAVVPPLRVAHYFGTTPYFQLDVALTKVAGRRVAFLVRDPRDVVVSYFHHTMRRAEAGRERGKPVPASDVDLSEFIRSETHGIRAIVEYMNQVIERGPRAFGAFRSVQYEELVKSPRDTFTELLAFFGADVDEQAVAAAVARASFDNLQRLEMQRRTRKGAPAPPPDALRFRRGVPGAYRTELAEPDVAYLDKIIDRHLDLRFAPYRS